jgi:hypothetical protein
MLVIGAVVSFALAGVVFGFQNRHKHFGQWWNNAGWLVFVVALVVATAIFFRLGWIHGY